jgi:cation diffusion facilitator family transporter
MKHCCESKSTELVKLRSRQGRVLKIVLLVNATMFIVEAVSGILSHSTALLADSLDMFGDATVYGFSLYVLHRSLKWKSRAGLLKGGIMSLFGIGVLVDAGIRYMDHVTPVAGMMGSIAAVALLANAACLYLLYTHRQDDINMKSTWVCSRNDLIANVSVIGASGLVAVFHSAIPDLAVGVLIALLFLSSAFGVVRDSLSGLHDEEVAAHS